MEHVYAHDGMRKDVPSNLQETLIHVTAEESDYLALFYREFPKVAGYVGCADLRKNVNDNPRITVSDVTVHRAIVPSFSFRIPFAGIAFKLINAQHFG